MPRIDRMMQLMLRGRYNQVFDDATVTYPNMAVAQVRPGYIKGKQKGVRAEQRDKLCPLPKKEHETGSSYRLYDHCP